MVIKNTYKLTCRHCAEVAASSPKICVSCGPIQPNYELIQTIDSEVSEDSTKSLKQLICPSCALVLESLSDDKTPSTCGFCSKKDLDWYDPDHNLWASDPLPQMYQDSPGRWLKGEFEGFYEAGAHLLKAPEPLKIHLYKGLLKNVQLVEGPPIREIGQVPPFLQSEVSSIEAARGISDDEPVSLQLVDFQLHEWQQVNSFESRDDKKSLYGKIYGIAYGKLLEIPEEKELIVPKDIKDDTEESNEEDKISDPTVIDTPPKPIDVVDTSLPPELPMTTSCSKCRKISLFLPFIVMFITGIMFNSGFFGSVQEAIITIIPLGLICLLQLWIEPPVNAYFSDDDETDLGGGIILVTLGLIWLAILWAFGFDNCDHYLKWWVWIPGLLLVLTVFIRRCWPWFMLLLIWMLMVFVSYHNPMLECKPSSTPVAITPTPVSPGTPGGQQNPSTDPPKQDNNPQDTPKENPNKQTSNMDQIKDNVLSVLDKINQEIVNVEKDSSVDNSIINQGGRVKLEAALRNPQKYFSCNDRKGNKQPIYDIYIGKDALFEFNSVEITPDADQYLNKVVQLINTQPNTMIVFTGYSDDVGSEFAKLQVSKLRSNELAVWLIEKKGVNPNQLLVSGSGDLNPITTSPEYKRLNRRVEMRLDCASTVKK